MGNDDERELRDRLERLQSELAAARETIQGLEADREDRDRLLQRLEWYEGQPHAHAITELLKQRDNLELTLAEKRVRSAGLSGLEEKRELIEAARTLRRGRPQTLRERALSALLALVVLGAMIAWIGWALRR